jgi:hypothetical protein
MAAVGALVALGFGASSCAGEGELEAFGCPNREVFVNSVSPYLERRCGTLDCHGSMTRPMRIYGQLGLRHPEENNVSGGIATTALELDSNFASVCNVDPEPMQEVTDDRGASADKLLIVNKARGLERHKGGKIVDIQDPGDRCITGWLRLTPADQVEAACNLAIEPLK